MDTMVPKNTKLYRQQLREIVPFLKKSQAANKIKNEWRKYKQRINSPSKRTMNNPAWKATFLRQARSVRRKEIQGQANNKQILPKFRRHLLARWVKFNDGFMSINGKDVYYPKLNTLITNGKAYNARRFGLVANNWK